MRAENSDLMFLGPDSIIRGVRVARMNAPSCVSLSSVRSKAADVIPGVGWLVNPRIVDCNDGRSEPRKYYFLAVLPVTCGTNQLGRDNHGGCRHFNVCRIHRQDRVRTRPAASIQNKASANHELAAAHISSVKVAGAAPSPPQQLPL
jgi:hypothetical protein